MVGGLVPKSTGLVFDSAHQPGLAEPPAATLKDYSRWGNDGTFGGAGAPDWVRLPSGLWVLEVNGDDDYITLDSIIYLPADFTYMAWVNRTDDDSYDFWIAGINNDDRVGWSDANTYIAIAGNPLWVQAGIAPTVGVWSLVVLRRLNGTLSQSINGGATQSDAGNAGTAKVRTLCSQATHTLSWGGRMSSPIVLSYSITQGQILQYHEKTRRLFGV